jgi:hypothetical protein
MDEYPLSLAGVLPFGNGKDRTSARAVPEIAMMGRGEEPQNPRLENTKK